VNAFFVREDLCEDHFAQPFTAENHYGPPRYGLAFRSAHPPGFNDDGSVVAERETARRHRR
jgi:hypothetical protein